MKQGLFLTGFALFGLSLISFTQTQVGNSVFGEFNDDRFGTSVSMDDSGEFYAVGARYSSYDSKSNSGHVEVHQWQNGSWNQVGNDIVGEAAQDQSGWSVSLSGDASTVAIGSRENDGNGASSGHVRVYFWDGTAWQQKGGDLDGEAAGDEFGQSVSLSTTGDILAVGARFNDGNGTDAGHTRVFSWDGTSWVQLGLDLDGESADDASGQSVSLSADGFTLAVGERRNDDNGGNAGQVRVYTWDGTSWNQKGNDLLGDAAGDQFGWSVSISDDGDDLVVGSPNNDTQNPNAGRAKVFTWDGTSWNLKGSPINGGTEEDKLGWCVSMNSNGSVFSVGIRKLNVGSYGALKLYEWDGTDWIQKGNVMTGDMNGAEFGYSNSISANGNAIVGGAYLHSEGTNIYNGQAKVYCFQPNVDSLPDVQACDEYELPELNQGSYYTVMGGNGTSYSGGDIITVSQTLYIYDKSLNCAADEQSFAIDIQNCASLDEENMTDYIVYPNPSNEFINVKAKSTNNAYFITNQLGQTVLHGTFDTMETKIDLSDLEKGSYFFLLNGNVKKIIVQ